MRTKSVPLWPSNTWAIQKLPALLSLTHLQGPAVPCWPLSLTGRGNWSGRGHFQTVLILLLGEKYSSFEAQQSLSCHVCVNQQRATRTAGWSAGCMGETQKTWSPLGNTTGKLAQGSVRGVSSLILKAGKANETNSDKTGIFILFIFMPVPATAWLVWHKW